MAACPLQRISRHGFCGRQRGQDGRNFRGLTFRTGKRPRSCTVTPGAPTCVLQSGRHRVINLRRRTCRFGLCATLGRIDVMGKATSEPEQSLSYCSVARSVVAYCPDSPGHYGTSALKGVLQRF